MLTSSRQVVEVGRQVGADRGAQGVELGGRGEWRRDGRGGHGGQSRPLAPCYPARTVRLVETRLLEGPNVYRLEPVVKLEVAIGRRRTWYGQRDPGRHALVHLGADVPARDWPDPIAATVAWIRRLRTDHGEGRSGLAVHRSSDPGHWIITFPWIGAERAQTITEAALALAERDVSPSRTAQLTGAQERTAGALDGAHRGGPGDAARMGPRRRSARPDRVDLRDQRQEHGDPADHPHPGAGRPAGRDDHLGRRPRRRADGRAGRLDRARRRAPGPGPARRRRRGARDGPRRDRPARRRLRVERRERPDQRLVRPPRPAGHPHPARAGRGQVDDLPDHEARRLGRAQRRRPAGRRGRPAGQGPGRAVHAATATSRRSSRAIGARGGRAYLVRDGFIVEANGASETADRRGRPASRSRSADWRATTSPTRWPRPAARAGWAPRSSRSATA